MPKPSALPLITECSRARKSKVKSASAVARMPPSAGGGELRPREPVGIAAEPAQADLSMDQPTLVFTRRNQAIPSLAEKPKERRLVSRIGFAGSPDVGNSGRSDLNHA